MKTYIERCQEAGLMHIGYFGNTSPPPLPKHFVHYSYKFNRVRSWISPSLKYFVLKSLQVGVCTNPSARLSSIWKNWTPVIPKKVNTSIPGEGIETLRYKPEKLQNIYIYIFGSLMTLLGFVLVSDQNNQFIVWNLCTKFSQFFNMAPLHAHK